MINTTTNITITTAAAAAATTYRDPSFSSSSSLWIACSFRVRMCVNRSYRQHNHLLMLLQCIHARRAIPVLICPYLTPADISCPDAVGCYWQSVGGAYYQHWSSTRTTQSGVWDDPARLTARAPCVLLSYIAARQVTGLVFAHRIANGDEVVATYCC